MMIGDLDRVRTTGFAQGLDRSTNRLQLYNSDCLDVLPTLEKNSIDCIITDPPYFKVKNEFWDRQWDNPEQFLQWLDRVLVEFYRVLKSNGSLYMFASPQMSARVELLIGERFEVLNRIVWQKPKFSTKAEMLRKEDLRKYFSASESLVFAEHKNAESYAKDEAGYSASCDELRGFVFEPLRKYICDEFERAGMLSPEGKIATNVACGFSASSGGMASRHYFSQSQWCLPTREHYAAMQALLNKSDGDYLRREYDYLRREYEDLRREYEDLRRPFNATPDRPYTDVWTYKTVQAYPGKHPCEKPLDMLTHMVETSTRPGSVVLDAFMGTGNTGIACKKTGRKFVGIEQCLENFNLSNLRISPPQYELF